MLRLRNFCNQKNIDYIDETITKEDHMGNKKLHLKKKRQFKVCTKLTQVFTIKMLRKC